MTDPYAPTGGSNSIVCTQVLRITMENGRMNTTDAALHANSDIWRDVGQRCKRQCMVLTSAGTVFGRRRLRHHSREYRRLTRARQWKEARDIVYSLINCSKPVVSAMRGLQSVPVSSWSIADISIATKDCRIIDGHTRLGVAAAITPRLGRSCGLPRPNITAARRSGPRRGGGAHRLISLAVEDAELDAKAVELRLAAEGAERDPLDQMRVEQLAARHGPDIATAGARVVGFHRSGGQGRPRTAKGKPAFPPAPPL
jgi:enoyl-CoA hydratase